MPTSAEHLLLDTSAALALVQAESVHHRAVRAAVVGSRIGLSGHAAFEFLSVLTRLPPPLRLTGDGAAHLMATNFPHTRHLGAGVGAALVAEFATRGIVGGAVYDGLVAAAAREHDLPLLTCDRRALGTYAALGVRVIRL